MMLNIFGMYIGNFFSVSLFLRKTLGLRLRRTWWPRFSFFSLVCSRCAIHSWQCTGVMLPKQKCKRKPYADVQLIHKAWGREINLCAQGSLRASGEAGPCYSTVSLSPLWVSLCDTQLLKSAVLLKQLLWVQISVWKYGMISYMTKSYSEYFKNYGFFE